MGLFSKLKKKKPEEKGLKEAKKKEEKEKGQDDVAMADLYTGKEPKAEKEEKKAKEGKKQAPAKVVKGDTKNAYKVLIKPVVSEKASFIGQYNQYIFEVALKANKIEVKKAIKALYGVDAIKVNIVNISGKNIRYGRQRGKTKKWKKAIITLKEGQSIQVYEGI